MSDFDEDAIEAILLEELSNGASFDPMDRGTSSAPIGAVVVNWRTLDPEQAPQVWEELRKFVEWFTTRYNLSSSVVPDCWFQHGAMVEELSALHIAHTVYFDPADGGAGPIGWHERLTLAITRIKAAYSNNCQRGHAATAPRVWAPHPNWASWITSSHGN